MRDQLLPWLLAAALTFVLAGCPSEETDDDDDDDDTVHFLDQDGDGYGESVDCDDTDDTVWPGAEDPCDDVDQNCDGIDGSNIDGDPFSTCQQDCDDTDAGIHPLAEEEANGVDDDCDGLIDEVTYSCENPETEPNDEADDANAMGPSDVICGVINPAGDEDWFAFEVDAYTMVNFDVDAADQGSTLSPKIDVWSTDGVSERCGTVGTNDPQFTSFFARAGTYYVSMADLSANGAGLDYFYTLDLTATSPCDATESEPNANDGQANPITTAQVTCGHVDSDDDKDYFSVQIGAGETWDITVDSFAVGSTLKGQLTLFDTDGVTELAYDDPTYPNDPIITHTFGAAGRYYLQVESDFYGTYDSGGYLLSFN